MIADGVLNHWLELESVSVPCADYRLPRDSISSDLAERSVEFRLDHDLCQLELENVFRPADGFVELLRLRSDGFWDLYSWRP